MLSQTLILIAITCAVSLVGFGNPRMVEALLLWPPAISRKGEYHRLLTYGLVHGDFAHLLFNMITLFFFGRAMEPFFGGLLGSNGFAFFYVLGLVASIVPTYFRHRNDAGYRSLGASGAVSGVLFAFILLQPWAIIYVYAIPVPAIVYAALYTAYTIVMDRRGGDNVNHSAHLWGAAYGVVFTIAIAPGAVPYFFRSLFNPGG